MHRFDLEIEDHHTYLADGVVVHNSPETTTGGRASSSTRPSGSTSAGRTRSRTATRSIGGRTQVKVVKNKLAPPFREAEFDVIYGEGISKEGDVLDPGVEQDVVEKSGAWYSYKGSGSGRGGRTPDVPQGAPRDGWRPRAKKIRATRAQGGSAAGRRR